MKSTKVTLVLLMAELCTTAYFDHASSHGTEAEETTLLANSYASKDGTSSAAGGMNLGRKLMAGSTIVDSVNSVSTMDSNRGITIQQYRDLMSQICRRS
ncbi:unnamed protein product [Urochloa decumbens]|uniref:Uncharacterized protein n=1 Tax=Urochloa decumbens TaxID=240449 RepID=A0ABC9DB70_9POAL